MRFLILALILTLVILPIIWIIISNVLNSRNIDPTDPLRWLAVIIVIVFTALFHKEELSLFGKIYTFALSGLVGGFFLSIMEEGLVVPLWEDFLEWIKSKFGGIDRG
jgi:riboflavin transporter FmnP